LTELLNINVISIDLRSKEKEGVLSELVDLLVRNGEIEESDKEGIICKLKERESLGSTGIGKGVGIPHAKSPFVKKLVAAFGISKGGVSFKSLDGELTYIVFLMVAPSDSTGPHLKALAKVSRLLDDRFVRDKLKSATTPDEVLNIFKEEEQKKVAR